MNRFTKMMLLLIVCVTLFFVMIGGVAFTIDPILLGIVVVGMIFVALFFKSGEEEVA